MPRPIALQISLSALRHNLQQVRSSLAQQGQHLNRASPYVWAVIKANAYGHGIAQAVSAFQAADGLAMLDLNEAVLCRQLGWTKPVMLLEGVFEPKDFLVVDEHRITVVIHSWAQIEWLQQIASSLAHPVDVMLKLNTGMNRLGFAPAQFRDAFDALQQLQAEGKVGQLGKMTHFARADDNERVTQQQIDCFNQVTEGLPGVISLCNSAGTLSNSIQPALSADHEQWVRPGVCLYGASPFATKSAQQLGLLPVQTLTAEIISVQDVAANQGVGYGHGYTSHQVMRIGVVACGYADGYPRHAPNGTPVYVAGKATQLVGRVSMDMMMVDLTHIPEAEVGAKVVLWGHEGPSVDDVAKAAGTIGYELLCAVTARVPRNVLD